MFAASNTEMHTATRKFVAAPPVTHIDVCDDDCGDDDEEGTDADANNGNDLSVCSDPAVLRRVAKRSLAAAASLWTR